MSLDFSIEQIANGWVVEIDVPYNMMGVMGKSYYASKDEALQFLIDYLEKEKNGS